MKTLYISRGKNKKDACAYMHIFQLMTPHDIYLKKFRKLFPNYFKIWNPTFEKTYFLFKGDWPCMHIYAGGSFLCAKKAYSFRQIFIILTQEPTPECQSRSDNFYILWTKGKKYSTVSLSTVLDIRNPNDPNVCPQPLIGPHYQQWRMRCSSSEFRR